MNERELLPAPRDAAEAFSLAKMLAESDLVPKDFKNKPQNVLVCMMWSHTLGIPVVQGLQYIAVVNGRPSMYGDGLLAVCMSSGKLESIDEEIKDVNGSLVATCTVKRRGMNARTSVFSQEDAKKAGLWSKSGPWSQYPKRMLQMRARGFALRDVFPDVLSGISSAEEQRDIIDVEGEVVEPKVESPKSPAMPRRRKEIENNPSPAASEVIPQEVKTASPEPAESPESAQETGKSVYGLPGDLLDRIEKCTTTKELLSLYRELPEALKQSSELIKIFGDKKDALQALAAEAQQ